MSNNPYGKSIEQMCLADRAVSRALHVVPSLAAQVSRLAPLFARHVTQVSAGFNHVLLLDSTCGTS